jgi:hypothetical protein
MEWQCATIFKGDRASARRHCMDSYVTAKALRDNRFCAENLILFAQLFLHDQRYDSAYRYFRRAEQLSTAFDYDDLRLQSYDHLSKVCEAMKLFQKETSYRTRYIDLEDTMQNEALTQTLMVTQAEYEQLENTTKINAQKELLRLKENVIARQKTINILSVIAVTLLCFVIMLLYRTQRHNDLSQISLERQVNEKTQALREKYALTQRSMEAKASFYRKAKNELKNKTVTLSGLISIVDLKRTAEHTRVQLNSSLTDLSKSIERIDLATSA